MNSSVKNERNPQAAMMADESMVRTLAAQVEAIWPQEQLLLSRYELADDCRILDVGCGTGEFSARVARHYSRAPVTGVDVEPRSLATARSRYTDVAARLTFELGDAFHLRFADESFDMVACRHVTQAVPDVDKLFAELLRVTRPGGWVHVLSEDYAMLHMMSGPLDSDVFWQQGPINYADKTGTDARIGRKSWTLLKQLGLQDLRVDYVIVDTLRVKREVFAGIIMAWRDGYTEALAAHATSGQLQARQHFDEIIASILNPDHYAVWFVPIVSGQRRNFLTSRRALVSTGSV
jgi:ubiquinone/menaquinone biosynthesis C-methylase UbiE